MVTAASSWQSPNITEPDEMTLPSGNVATLEFPGMEAFIEAGLIPNSLVAIVQTAIDNNEKPKSEEEQKKEVAKLLEPMKTDVKKMAEFMQMLNLISVRCFVTPPVELPPAKGEERSTEILYTDRLSVEDKMFVFNVAVGGSKDLERFREELASGMEPVQAEPKPKKPTKRTTEPKRKSKV